MYCSVSILNSHTTNIKNIERMIEMTKKIYIEGMSCSHCVGHVEEALKEICGVKEVTVELDK